MTVDTRRPLPRFRHDDLPGAMYAPEPDRHIYLAPYIGAGTDADPFRPRGTDDTPGWSAIDLRPDATTSDSGHAIVITPTRLPVRDEAHAVYLGDDPDLSLPTIVRQHVEDRAHVGRGDLPDRMRGDRCIVADLLTLMADDTDPSRPNVLRPERDKVLRIHLGGEVWWEKALPAGGSTLVETWDGVVGPTSPGDIDGDLEWTAFTIASTTPRIEDGVLVTLGGQRGQPTGIALGSNDHYAEVVLTNNNLAATCRMADNVNFYEVRSQSGWRIDKRVDDAFSNVALGASPALGALPGTVRLEVEGSTLRAALGGDYTADYTDTSLSGPDRAGFSAAATNSRISRWEAGVLGAVGPVGPFLRTGTGGFLRTASGILRPA